MRFEKISIFQVAWIKIDFNKWKDEDEEHDEEGGDAKFDNFDFSSLGLPSGSAGMNNFEDDLGDLSDDEEGRKTQIQKMLKF